MTVTRLPPGRHRDLLEDAIRIEGEAQRELLSGDIAAARSLFLASADLYRESYDCAPPGGYGRLMGMLKASIIAGDTSAAVGHARTAIADAAASPTVGYVRAIVALIDGDVAATSDASALMRTGGEAFVRAADAAEAIAGGDPAAFPAAIAAIVDDFAAREAHLTGVAIADTAVMFDRLARTHGLTHDVRSPLLP